MGTTKEELVRSSDRVHQGTEHPLLGKKNREKYKFVVKKIEACRPAVLQTKN